MFYDWPQHTPEMEATPPETEAKDGAIESILVIESVPLDLAMPEAHRTLLLCEPTTSFHLFYILFVYLISPEGIPLGKSHWTLGSWPST